MLLTLLSPLQPPPFTTSLSAISQVSPSLLLMAELSSSSPQMSFSKLAPELVHEIVLYAQPQEGPTWAKPNQHRYSLDLMLVNRCLCALILNFPEAWTHITPPVKLARRAVELSRSRPLHVAYCLHEKKEVKAFLEAIKPSVERWRTIRAVTTAGYHALDSILVKAVSIQSVQIAYLTTMDQSPPLPAETAPLRSLTLHGCSVMEFIRHTNLKSVTFDLIQISLKALLGIVQFCPMLSELDIWTSCCDRSQAGMIGTPESAFNACLQRLTLWNLEDDITAYFLQRLIVPNLKELTISVLQTLGRSCVSDIPVMQTLLQVEEPCVVRVTCIEREPPKEPIWRMKVECTVDGRCLLLRLDTSCIEVFITLLYDLACALGMGQGWCMELRTYDCVFPRRQIQQVRERGVDLVLMKDEIKDDNEEEYEKEDNKHEMILL